MCFLCLDSAKLTAGKIHDSPAVNELCTPYSDLTFRTDCSGIKDAIHLLRCNCDNQDIPSVHIRD